MNWNFRLGPLQFRSPATVLGLVLVVAVLFICCIGVPCLVGAGV